MDTEQAEYPVEFVLLSIEKVIVKNVYSNDDTQQVIVVLDREWETISDELRDQLIKEYDLNGHWREDGWTLSFVFETDEA